MKKECDGNMKAMERERGQLKMFENMRENEGSCERKEQHPRRRKNVENVDD